MADDAPPKIAGAETETGAGAGAGARTGAGAGAGTGTGAGARTGAAARTGAGAGARTGTEAGSHAGFHAEAALRRTRDLVEPVLRAAVDMLPGRLRAISAYHFGWEDAEGLAIEGIGGKLLRPGLVLAAAAAVGGEPVADSAVLAAAAAVELAHNFTLLHDDVIDRDHTRRHRPTAWTVFGAENAILAGDAMLALALRLVGGEAASRLAECGRCTEKCPGKGRRGDAAPDAGRAARVQRRSAGPDRCGGVVLACADSVPPKGRTLAATKRCPRGSPARASRYRIPPP